MSAATRKSSSARLHPPTPSKYNGHHANGLQIPLHAHRPGVHAYTKAMPAPAPRDVPLCNATTGSLYDGAELRAPLRHGAADHEQHPSRIGNARVWRDGRVGDGA